MSKYYIGSVAFRGILLGTGLGDGHDDPECPDDRAFVDVDIGGVVINCGIAPSRSRAVVDYLDREVDVEALVEVRPDGRLRPYVGTLVGVNAS